MKTKFLHVGATQTSPHHSRDKQVQNTQGQERQNSWDGIKLSNCQASGFLSMKSLFIDRKQLTKKNKA